MDAQKRISELIDLINYHNDKYYNEDKPEIEDFEYDNLMKELIKLEEENPSLKRIDSPSNRVGGKALDKFDQVTHKIPMLSLSNAYSAADLREVTQEEWMKLLDAVTSIGGYETVILDLEGTVEEQLGLLAACTHIYTPVCDGVIAKARMEQYKKLLTELDAEEILKETSCLHLPYAEPAAVGEYALEQLVNSEMGNFVRTLLCSEEWKK